MKQPNQALAFRLEREKTAGKKILYFDKQKKSTHNECFFSRKFFN